MRARQILGAGWTGLCLAISAQAPGADVTVRISTPMPPPAWAVLERRLLAENVPACREFFRRYFDDRGYLQCFVRWGAHDGPGARTREKVQEMDPRVRGRLGEPDDAEPVDPSQLR